MVQNDPDAAADDNRLPTLGELARILPKGSKFGKPYLVPPEYLDEWKRGGNPALLNQKSTTQDNQKDNQKGNQKISPSPDPSPCRTQCGTQCGTQCHT